MHIIYLLQPRTRAYCKVSRQKKHAALNQNVLSDCLKRVKLKVCAERTVSHAGSEFQTRGAEYRRKCSLQTWLQKQGRRKGCATCAAAQGAIERGRQNGWSEKNIISQGQNVPPWASEGRYLNTSHRAPKCLATVLCRSHVILVSYVFDYTKFFNRIAYIRI
jgi:hypothetical protein